MMEKTVANIDYKLSPSTSEVQEHSEYIRINSNYEPPVAKAAKYAA